MVAITETGLISIITIGTAFLSACLGFCYKSKCSRIKLGCLEIDRDTKGEVKEDLAQMGNKNLSRETTHDKLNTKKSSFDFRRNSLPSRSENVFNQV